MTGVGILILLAIGYGHLVDITCTGFPDLLLSSIPGSLTIQQLEDNKTSRVLIDLYSKDNSYANDVDYLFDQSEIYYTLNTVQSDKPVILWRIFANQSHTGLPENIGEIDWRNFKIDWLNYKLYTYGDIWIVVHDLNSKKKKTLKSGCNGFTTGLVLNPLKRQMFWSCILSSGHGYIQTSGMDGQLLDGTIDKDLVYPTNLQLDINQGRIYWYDYIKHVVSSDTYNGSNRIIHFKHLPFMYQQFLVYKNEIFRIDKDFIYACQLLMTDNCTAIHKAPVIHKMVVYESEMKPKGENPCEDKCTHLCLLSPEQPYYSCQCPDFYVQDDNNTCELPPLLLVAGYRAVRLLDINGSTLAGYEIENAYDTETNDVDFMYRQNRILWTQGYKGDISFMEIDYPKAVKTLEIGRVDWLAVDWVTEKVYYLSSDLKVTTLNGNMTKTVLQKSSLRRCDFTKALALDPSIGIMFWMCVVNPENTTLWRASMSGYHGVSVVLDNDIMNSFCLDIKEKRIYWTNRQAPFLESRRYDGSDHVILLEEVKGFTIDYEPSLKMFHDFFYFKTETEIIVFDKVINRYQKLVSPGIRPIHRIGVFHADLQPRVFSPCNVNNGNCSHLCLLSSVEPFYECVCPDGYINNPVGDVVFCENLYPCRERNGGCSHICYESDIPPYFYCGCPVGLKLHNDNSSCSTDFEEVLLVSSYKVIHKIWMHGDNISSTELSFSKAPGDSEIISVDYDPVEQYLYWMDYRGMIWTDIRRSGVDGQGVHVIRSDQKCFRDIAVDWIDRRFYISDLDRIYVTDMDGQDLQPFVYSTALMLSLDLFNGYLYWVSCIPRYIKKMSTDGKEQLDVIQSGCMVSCMCFQIFSRCAFFVDYRYGKIYWSNQNTIMVANIDGTGIKTVFIDTDENYHNSLFSTGDVLLWTTSEDIKRLNMSQPTNRSILAFQSNDIRTIKVVYQVYSESEKIQCSKFAQCPGLRERRVCLNSSTICNGVDDCYGGHDEIFCSVCNEMCYVMEVSLTCQPTSAAPVTKDKDLSALVSWSSHPFSKFIHMEEIIHLRCQLQMAFSGYTDDYNGLRQIHFRKLYIPRIFRQVISSLTFRKLEYLTRMTLSGGNMLSVTDVNPFICCKNLEELTVTSTQLSYISKSVFKSLQNLNHLNISKNAILLIDPVALVPLRQLKILDMRNNKISFTPNLFQNNDKLVYMYTDVYVFCCIRPVSVTKENCVAPEDSISSCSNIIKYEALKVGLWIMGVLAASVNIGTVIINVYQNRKDKSGSKSFHIFVRSLAVSDTIMGIYMLIIAAHDDKYDGSYFLYEQSWRNSYVCKMSGIMAMTSSESSVLFICLITFDRYLAVKYPFKSIHISRRFAYCCSAIAWLICLSIAVIPAYMYNDFYSKSGVCVALPLTQDKKDDFTYSAAVFLGLNSFLFFIIVTGQVLIYRWIRKSSLVMTSQQRSRNKMAAILLFTVAMTDALCWIPVGVMGLASIFNAHIPNDAYAWVVVLVLPVNSAINPFIYTILAVCRSKKKNVQSHECELKRHGDSSEKHDTAERQSSKTSFTELKS